MKCLALLIFVVCVLSMVTAKGIDCLENRANAIGEGDPGAYIPDCDEFGYYQKRQCRPIENTCWCVNIYGRRLSKSSQYFVDCNLENY